MLDAEYWQARYANDNFPWDIGYANTIHTDFVVKNIAKDARILIPGAGSGYEAEYLFDMGYINVFPLDYAPEAKERFLKRVPHFPSKNYLSGNFFEIEDTYDIVLEQTFFCAIEPSLRPKYVKHIHRILSTNGILFGVFFEMKKVDGPPFGGDKDEYRALFEKYFELRTLEKCKDSIPPRLGSELVIEFFKK